MSLMDDDVEAFHSATAERTALRLFEPKLHLNKAAFTQTRVRVRVRVSVYSS